MNVLARGAQFLFSKVGKILLTAMLLGIVVTQLDFQDFLSHLSKLTVLECAQFMGMAFVVLFLGAKRWQAVLKSLDQETSYKNVALINVIGHSFNQCLPSSVGGDFMRLMSHSVLKTDAKLTMMSVLLDRYMGFLGLCFLVCIILPSQFSFLRHTFLILPIVSILVTAVLSAFAIYYAQTFLQYIKRYRPQSLELLTTLFQRLRQMMHSPAVWIYSFLTSAALMGKLVYLNAILGLHLDVQTILVAMPLVFMFTSIPISFAGWGIREGAMVVILGVYGVPKEEALVLSVVLGILMLLSAIPGLIYYTLRGDRIISQQ